MWLWIVSALLQCLGLLVFVLVIAIGYRVKFPKKKESKLQKPNWEKDVVYLCQFPLCPSVRTISPFSLKLETWLRITGIKYENIFTKQFHPKTGQIPYIELNGEQIGDSNLIIDILKEKFDVNIDKDLTVEQAAMSHAATQMVECFTAQTGFHYRYGHHMKEFASVLRLGEYYASEKMIKYWTMFQPYSTRLRNFMAGLSRHENSVVWDLAAKDLSALSTWLGTKEYFHGSEPTTVDCMLFGHLVQFLYIDIGFPQKTFIDTNCSNLNNFVTKMKNTYWTDWDQSIEQSKIIMDEQKLMEKK